MLKSGGDPEKYEKSYEKTYKSKYEETNRNNSPYRNKINNDNNGRNAKSDVIMYFKRVIQYENDLEKYKQELYFRPDFNIFDLFNFADRDNKGYCSINDLENAFVAMNIEISSKGNWLFFKKTEKNNSGKIKFSEFSKNFIPILLDSPNQNDRRSINTDRRFDYL